MFWSQYDPYFWGNDANRWYYYDYPGDPDEFVPRRMHLLWLNVTRIYFNIGFDLFKKPKRK